MKHYTYRITNIIKNIHYYGTRSSKNPENDLGKIYFSSSSNKEFISDQKENPENYKYKIIRIFNTREDAVRLEVKLHNKFNVGINESFYNKVKQSSSKFDTTGHRKIYTKMVETRKKNGSYDNMILKPETSRKIRESRSKNGKGYIFHYNGKEYYGRGEIIKEIKLTNKQIKNALLVNENRKDLPKDFIDNLLLLKDIEDKLDRFIPKKKIIKDGFIYKIYYKANIPKGFTEFEKYINYQTLSKSRV